MPESDHSGNRKVVESKGRRFDSHRGQAYFSSLPGVDTAISIKVVPQAKRKSRIRARKAAVLGIANKFIHLLAIPSSLSRLYSTFPLCSGDNLN